MEQTDSCKCHCHAVFVTCSNYIIITHRSTWLCNISYTTLMCTLNIITEWEECIRTKRNTCQLVQPCSLLFSCKYFRFYLKCILPDTICENIHIFLSDVKIDRIISVCTSDSILELKSKYLRILT